jgi:thiamine biosynthesis lipoprotein ApbE
MTSVRETQVYENTRNQIAASREQKLSEALAQAATLRKALEEINSQAVCACIATEDECFRMLQNCAEISERALALSSPHGQTADF